MSDKELIKAMWTAYMDTAGTELNGFKAALAVARPVIERETREDCWRIAMQWAESSDTATEIAAAIRDGSNE